LKKVAILQPDFFPWISVFEHIRLADVYVHLNDVRFPTGRSFSNCMQIKTPTGARWLTAPVLHGGRQCIYDVTFDETQPWRKHHLRVLTENYSQSPHAEEMLQLAHDVYGLPTRYLAELNMTAIEKVAGYFGLTCQFARASFFPSGATGSQRLIELVKSLGGDVFVTGHLANHRLDLRLFEAHGVGVECVCHQVRPYTQLHGGLHPFVSILDVIANVGIQGPSLMASSSIPWRDFFRDGRPGAHAA